MDIEKMNKEELAAAFKRLKESKVPRDCPQEQSAHRLIDAVIDEFGLKNDAAFSRLTGINPVMVSKIRNRKSRVSSTQILAIHERTGMPVSRIRELLA
jgi:hypothetical protein